MRQGDNERLDLRPGYAVKRLQLVLRVAVNTAIGPTGLSMSQFAVLRVLADAGPVTAAELARRCFITRQSVRDVIKTLVEREMIEYPPARPRVPRRLRITECGLALLADAVDKVNEVDQRMLGDMTERQRAQFVSWLNMCADNLR